jgi:hypothetical protein
MLEQAWVAGESSAVCTWVLLIVFFSISVAFSHSFLSLAVGPIIEPDRCF